MPPASAAPVDDQLAPPSPRRPSGGLTFRQPETSPAEGLTTPAPAGEGASPFDDQLAGSPSGSEWSSDATGEDDESGPTSSRSSASDPASRKPFAKRAQLLAARQAVKIAGSMAHQHLARDEAAQAVGLYLVDDETAQQIGDPLARIAARHAPIDGGAVNEDVADGIAAMLGVAKFVSLTIEKSSEAAALRLQHAPTAPPVDV